MMQDPSELRASNAHIWLQCVSNPLPVAIKPDPETLVGAVVPKVLGFPTLSLTSKGRDKVKCKCPWEK